uniref:hypothetical protein n=1 Tax=Pararhizobium sp. IMCC3301 TaxID=3067904 RepID=UPI002741D16E|nr:hypothetical protein [Pararhizobium sp. IMCC3301]
MCFKYDLTPFKAELHTNGYVHLKDVLSDTFVAELKDFNEKAMSLAAEENKSVQVKGKKRQFVFGFSSDETALEFRKGIACLTSMDEDKITISERHLKVYDEKANPWPSPHKDRCASQISIGLPIALSKGSTVAVFPTLDQSENPNDKAMFISESDNINSQQAYVANEAVLLNESVGDLILFNGSSIFHERVKAAGTSVLYIKINDKGDDPLGENIYTPAATSMAVA